MPFPLLLAGAVALGAGGKVFRGIKQGNEADDIMRNNKRPTRKTQQEFIDNASLAAFRAANAKLPGANTAEIKANAALTGLVNDGVNTQRDPSSIAALLAAGDKNYNDTLVNLADKGAAFQNQNINTLYQQRGILGNQNQANWDWNEKQKYLSAMAAASALKNASNSNIDSAVQDVASIGTAYGFNRLGSAGGAAGSTGEGAGKMAMPGSYDPLGKLGTDTGYTGLSTGQNKLMNYRRMHNDYTTPDAELFALIQ